MWIQTRAPSPSRWAETASSKSRAVAGSTVKVASAVRSRRGAGFALGRTPPPPRASTSSAARKPRKPSSLAQQRLDRLARRAPRRAAASPAPAAGDRAVAAPRLSRRPGRRGRSSARCLASSTAVCRVVAGLDVGVDAVAPRQVDALRGEVFADRQLQRAAVGEALLLLEDALAVGAGADHGGAAVVGQRRGEDLRRRGGAAVDQDDQRQLRQVCRRRSCGRCRPGCATWSRRRLRPRAGRGSRSAPPRRAGRRGCRAGRGRSLPRLRFSTLRDGVARAARGRLR